LIIEQTESISPIKRMYRRAGEAEAPVEPADSLWTTTQRTGPFSDGLQGKISMGYISLRHYQNREMREEKRPRTHMNIQNKKLSSEKKGSTKKNKTL